MTEFINEEGKTFGLLATGIFHKEVYRSKHMLRIPEAWAIDKGIIQQLEKDGTCTDITIHDRESDVTYQVKFKLFIKKKMFISRGHGEQYALPLEYWTHTHKEEK